MNVSPKSSASVQPTDAVNQSVAEESDKVVQARLFTAVETDDMETYRALIVHPAIDIIDAENSDGQRFLHVVVQFGRAEIAEQLIQQLDGTSTLDDLDHRGYTPLMYAVEKCQVGLVKSLLSAQAYPNVSLREQYDAMPQSSSSGRKAIHDVCFPSALQLAVSMYVNAVDPAVAQKGKEMVELLIAGGADASDALMRSFAMNDNQPGRRRA